jgi:hypothetical protein
VSRALKSNVQMSRLFTGDAFRARATALPTT